MPGTIATTFSLLLLASSSVANAQTSTLKAWFVPAHVDASVVAKAGDATTYALTCTANCGAMQNGQGTLINGPSTVGFSQVWKDDGAYAPKTLVYDCKVKDANGDADCAIKAGQEGKTGTISKATKFVEEPITITAGWDKLGIVIATTTKEANTTTSVKTSSSSPTATGYTSANQTSTTGFSNSTVTRTSSRSSLIPTTTRTTPPSSATANAASPQNGQQFGSVLLSLAAVGAVFAFL